LQLALWGAEDAILSSQPQVTYWKSVFRRASPFSMCEIEQNFAGASDFGKRTSMSLGRSGDLVYDVWLQLTLPSLWDYHEPLPALTATKPIIKYARYTSATSARIAIVPSLNMASDASQLYTATLTPVGGGTPVTATSTVDAPLIVEVTGLNATKEYDAVVEAVGQANDDPSDSTEVIALKWANSIGHAFINTVEFEIGSQTIDRHQSDWLDILGELTTPEEKLEGFHAMIGKYLDYDPRSDTKSSDAERTYYIPMQFFFNGNGRSAASGLALPLICLTFHECKLNFEFRPYKDCIRSTRRAVTTLLDDAGYPLAIKDLKGYANYIFLENTERQRFSSNPHEYLIETTQFLGDAAVILGPNDSLLRKIPLDFSHPVKEIVWVYNDYDTYTGDSTQLDWFNYGDEDWFTELKIQINGQDRFSSRPSSYFRTVQPYKHHTRVPSKNIYVYSFALMPELAQSVAGSGSCNYSRCDTSHLVATVRPNRQGRVRIFCTSFNVLRIANGLGGLSFAG